MHPDKQTVPLVLVRKIISLAKAKGTVKQVIVLLFNSYR